MKSLECNIIGNMHEFNTDIYISQLKRRNLFLLWLQHLVEKAKAEHEYTVSKYILSLTVNMSNSHHNGDTEHLTNGLE